MQLQRVMGTPLNLLLWNLKCTVIFKLSLMRSLVTILRYCFLIQFKPCSMFLLLISLSNSRFILSLNLHRTPPPPLPFLDQSNYHFLFSNIYGWTLLTENHTFIRSSATARAWYPASSGVFTAARKTFLYVPIKLYLPSVFRGSYFKYSPLISSYIPPFNQILSSFISWLDLTF